MNDRDQSSSSARERAQLRALAERAARVGGAAARAFADRPDAPSHAPAVLQKDDDSPVTAADRDSERAIRALLAAERPADAVLEDGFARRGNGALALDCRSDRRHAKFYSRHSAVVDLGGSAGHAAPVVNLWSRPALAYRCLISGSPQRLPVVHRVTASP